VFRFIPNLISKADLKIETNKLVGYIIFMLVVLVCISSRELNFCHPFTYILDDYHWETESSFVLDHLNWPDPHKFLGFGELLPILSLIG